MARADFGTMHCSMARALHVIGDPWTPLVVRDLYLGLSRYDELVVDLGISRNLLVKRLDHLVQAGVVARHRYSEHPPRDEYRLTDAGRDLAPILMALTAWGDRWFGPTEGSPILFRHACGEIVEPELTCPSCHAPFTTDSVTLLPGPGGKTAPGTALVGTMLDSGRTTG